MDFDAVLLPARRARMLEQKRWYQRTINDALDACVAQHPDKRALTTLRVAYDHHAAAGRITAAGLPESLARRLLEGR